MVDAIVDYLQPRSKGITDKTRAEGREGMTHYYADDGEEPGRWLGAGAAAHDLVGEVAADDLAAVLSGRDPRTGQRLITAQGSAGRRIDLGVGQATKLEADGTRLYDEADAAAALGLSRAEVARMLDVGTALAVGHLAVTPVGDRANDR
ncbi:MAG TPA: relaxase domain-containing protein, partial [Iamia sp.]|nr:relaxase domain-containing protein [Iamia sp.]